MRFEIRDLQKRLGITAIYVTHDQQEALVMSDKIAIMNNGRLMQLGTPEEVYEQPQNKFVAEFIGLSDFLPARIEAVDAKFAQVIVGQTRLRATASAGFAPNQSALLFIRPNDIEIAAEGARENVLSGVVKQATYLGETMDYRVEVSGGLEAELELELESKLELRVQTSAAHRFGKGARVRLHLPEGRLRVIGEE